MKATQISVIESFIQAQNNHDTQTLVVCFTPDGVVYDDGRAHQGIAAIQAWSEWVSKEFRPRIEVTDVAGQGNEFTITLTLSGTFDGSPIQFRYHFTLRGDKIAALRIDA